MGCSEAWIWVLPCKVLFVLSSVCSVSCFVSFRLLNLVVDRLWLGCWTDF